MVEIVIGLLLLVFGIRFISNLMEQEIREEINETREKLDQIIRMVTVETLPEHDNLILAYDGENHQFLGQGFSKSEVKYNIMKRFPENVFILGDEVFSALKKKEKVNA